MSTKRKGLVTVSGEWAKHLRKWGKREFWKGERRMSKEDAKRMFDQAERAIANGGMGEDITDERQTDVDRS
jgi:hypothetical protein